MDKFNSYISNIPSDFFKGLCLKYGSVHTYKNRKIFLILLFMLTVSHMSIAQDMNHSEKSASCASFSKMFNQIKAICDKDNGKLWGINLYAPILCIDKNRNVWSNQQDSQCQLQICGKCFIGKYPDDKNIANSTMNAFGQKWVTMMLPIPTDTTDRNILFCHEMFHYWQDSLGHVPTPYNNVHMETKEARILLKLEWKAFLSACKATNPLLREIAIRDGLTFRRQRQEEFSKYYSDETAFEVHEGLPQYTGMKLSISSDARYIDKLNKEAESYMKKDELVRCYAYLSGPIFGYLLDKSTNEWRKQVDGNSDLGILVQKAYNIVLPIDKENHIQQRKAYYDYDNIMTFENQRDSVRAIKKNELTALFTQDIKTLPLKNIQISFNPNTVVPLENIGIAYKNARIVDEWGILETKGNGTVLITEDWKTVILPYASSIEVNGNIEETEFWKLTPK